MFRRIEQSGVGRLLAVGIPPDFGGHARAAPAPCLGQDMEQVLADLLGLPSAEFGRTTAASYVLRRQVADSDSSSERLGRLTYVTLDATTVYHLTMEHTSHGAQAFRENHTAFEGSSESPYALPA